MFSGYGPPVLPSGIPTLMDDRPEKKAKPNLIKIFFRWIARLYREIG